jgi:hypothetical protein
MGTSIEAKKQSIQPSQPSQPKEAVKSKVVRQEDDPLNLAIRAHQNCNSREEGVGDGEMWTRANVCGGSFG